MALFQYNLGSEIPFSSIDYGFINETPTTPSEDHGDLAVVAQTTIAPDDIVSTYSGSLNTVTIANTGTGVGEYGGFNVARHIKFTGSGTRSFNFAFDTSNREEITFSVIRGTDSNGGELTDSGEDLLFEYSINGGSTWTGTQVLVAYNDTAFNTLNDVTVTLPTAARVSNAQFRIRQASNSGSNYDQWGVTAVTIGGEILTTEDYGFLTPARQTVPYGRLKIVEEFADERLLRNSVGGIEFTLGGAAHIFTLPIHVGRGFFRLDGKEFTRITLRYIGSGTFSHFGGSAEAVSNATPAQTPLFTVAGVATERFGKGNYTVTGQFSTFTGAAEVVSISGATRQDLFRIRGAAHDTHTENYVGEGRLFAVQGASEAFKVEEKASGLFSFKGTSKETIQSNNVVSVETQISGSGSESITPAVRPGSGEATFSGAITNEHVRFHQFGTGTLSSFSGTAETSNRVVFSYNESSVVNAETLDYGLITEGFADEPISNYANVPISTLANEVVSEFGRYPNREDFGHISIDPEQSIHTPGYNHVDYGHINTTNRFPFGKFQSEDGGDLTFESAKIGIRVRPITPGPTHRLAGEAGVFTLPIHFGAGYFRLAGESVVRIRAVYYGSGKFSNFGGSAEAISNVDSGRTVLFSVGGEALNKIRFVYIGTGSLFTFVSKTESTSVTEKPYVLHQFSGGAVEKNTENYVGRGALFGFVSSTEATVVKSTSSGLFKIHGSGIEKNTEAHVGEGSLFGFVSKTEATVVQSVQQALFRFTGAITNEHVRYHQFGTGTFSTFSGTAYHERVAFDYNEDSIVNVRHDNYGLITEGSADQPISDFANDPISLHANEQVSEFGRFANREDFGHISIDPEQSINTHGYNHDDYGFINTTNRFPFGGFTFDDGSVTSATSKFQVKLPVDGPVFQIKGEGQIYVLPVHIGRGVTRLGGKGIIKIRAVYYGSGTAFSFVSGAEVTCSVPPTEAPLLDFNGTATEKFGKGNYDASGTFSTFSGAAESTVINSKSQVLFDVNGTALEKHTENHIGKGSLFGFVSSSESTVIDSSTSGLFKFQGGAIEKNTENYVGSGTLFGFDSSTEATEVVSTTSGLFKFTGAATNVHVRFHQLGTGSLFGFNGGAESVTFDYNCHSSIVNIGADNYGFVTESVVDETISNYANVPISTYANEVVSDFGLDPRQESFGHISIDPEQSINTHGPYHEDYGLITEPEGGNKFPCVHIHIGGTRLTETRVRGYAGSGTFSAFNGAAEATAVQAQVSGLFKLHSTTSVKISLGHTGEGETNYQMPFNVIPFRDGDVVTQAYDLAYDIGSILTNTVFTERSGTGLGPTGGFAIGSHIRFGGNTNGTRSLKFRLDLSNSETITIAAIKGNGSNGGEEPDANENLLIRFTGVSGTQTVVSELDTTFNSLKEVVINIPVDARVENQEIEIYQQSNSGYLYDHYGVKSVRTTLQRFSSTNESITPAGEIGDAQIRFLDLALVEGVRVAFDYEGSGTLRLGLSSPGVTGDGSRGVTTFHLGHIGSGSFDINGNAVEKNTEAYLGSGSLFAFTGGADSVVRDIPETATLFRFAGNGIEKNTENYVGRGALFGFVSKTESTTSAEEAKVLFNIEGASVNRILFHYLGSGTFSKFGGAAEARAVVKKAGGLFTFNGNAPESITPAPEIGSGSLFTFVGKTEAFAASDDFAPPLFKIGGDAIIGFSLGIIGRGGLDVLQKVTKLDVEGKNRFVGAQERRAVNNPASVLFSIDGNVKIFFVFQEVGGGFTRIGGEAFTEVTPRHTGRGKVSLHGDVTMSASLSHIGSGTIFGFIGGAESRTIEEAPRRGLLRFAGTAPEAFQRGPEIGTASLQIKSSDVFVRFKLSHISDGSRIHVDGDGAEARVRLYEGSGTLFGFSGATESRTIDLPPQVPTLFEFSGNSGERETNAHQGTGSLFGFDSATEVRTVSPELSGLFKVQGTGAEAKTKVFTGSGTFDLNTKTDGLDVAGKQVYISAPERTTVNPPEETQVFSFNGAAVAKELRSHTGRGSLFGFTGAAESRAVAPDSTGLFKVQGSGEESRSRIYSGTGRVFGFTGGAEATAVTENVPGSLFKLTGTVRVLFQRTPFIGSGSLFSFTGATETTAVAPPVATLFEFNGNGAESRTRPYQGSGTLVTFKSATISRRVPYDATQGLFKLAGALKESFVPSTYVGTTGVQFIGASADRRIEFEPPKPTQIYIV